MYITDTKLRFFLITIFINISSLKQVGVIKQSIAIQSIVIFWGQPNILETKLRRFEIDRSFVPRGTNR